MVLEGDVTDPAIVGPDSGTIGDLVKLGQNND
jgi:hypothetical protein